MGVDSRLVPLNKTCLVLSRFSFPLSEKTTAPPGSSHSCNPPGSAETKYLAGVRYIKPKTQPWPWATSPGPSRQTGRGEERRESRLPATAVSSGGDRQSHTAWDQGLACPAGTFLSPKKSHTGLPGQQTGTFRGNQTPGGGQRGARSVGERTGVHPSPPISPAVV